ncbi:hypothetical protein [Streptomyces sp. NPDC005336]|uniref:hypothetical protein n=1 Tax=unclassified Streptomyces TaxID=2593676 RepID=UPI0033B3FC32
MSAQESAVGADRSRSDDRSPSMTELLAACAAASAVSTPPTEEPPAAEPTENDQPPADETRDAA